MNAHLTDQQLNAYLHQTLNDAERETLDVHLTSCPSCRTQLSDMDVLQQRVHRELSAELRAVSVPLSLTFETIEPQLKRQRSFNRPVTRSRSFTLLALAISAVMVVVVVNLFTRTNFLATPSAQPLLSTTSTPFAMPDKATLVDSVLAGTSRSLVGNRIFQGEVIQLALSWYIPSPTDTEYSCFIHAVDQQGRTVVLADLSLERGEPHYPTVPAPNFGTFPGVHVPLPYDLAPGQYQIIAGIYDVKSGQRLTLAQGGTTVTIGTVEIDAWLARFGYGTTLVKSAFNDTHFHPGDTLTVDLSWYIFDAEGYTSFLHVLDSQNQVVAQAELPLAAIKASNVREQPNAPYLIGQSKLQLPTNLPDGEYQIAVGIYDDQTGQRVTTYQDETAVPIGTIEVQTDLTVTADTKHVHLVNVAKEYVTSTASHFEIALRNACQDLGCAIDSTPCTQDWTGYHCSPYSSALSVTVYVDPKATALYGWMNDDQLLFKTPPVNFDQGPQSVFNVPDSLALLVEKVARSVYGWPPQTVSGLPIFQGIVDWETYQLDQRLGGAKLADPFQPDRVTGITLPPLESLWVSGPIVSETREMQSEAAALIAFVEKEFGAPAVGKLLKAIGHANSLPEAIESSLNLKYPDFEQRWRDWLKQYNLK